MFVKDILIDPIDHAMNIKTIAEFMKNIGIQHQLDLIGIDFAQGHGIGHPFPIDDLVK